MQRKSMRKVRRLRAKPILGRSARSSSASHPLLELQRCVGDQAVQRLIQSPVIRAKLQVSFWPDEPGEFFAESYATWRTSPDYMKKHAKALFDFFERKGHLVQ